jgi:hypothetical protein
VLKLLTVLGCFLLCSFAQERDGSDRELARRLAAEATRSKAVADVVASGGTKVGLLLTWCVSPPADIDVHELDVGLADAFGRLKTRAAIPFLDQNIGIDRTPAGNTWLKSAEVLEDRLASVTALIRIGPDAAKAVIKAYGSMQANDRLAAIFVISRLEYVPEAKAFLTSALGQANLERYWAEDGLRRLDGRQ